MNTSGLLQSPLGFKLTLQETRSIHYSMNISKMKFFAYIYILLIFLSVLLSAKRKSGTASVNTDSQWSTQEACFACVMQVWHLAITTPVPLLANEFDV